MSSNPPPTARDDYPWIAWCDTDEHFESAECARALDEIDSLRAALRVAQEATRTATEDADRLAALVLDDDIGPQGAYARWNQTGDTIAADVLEAFTEQRNSTLAAHAAAVAARTTGDATLRLPTGARYVENAPYGIATGGGSVVFGGTSGVFVECIECSRRDAIQPFMLANKLSDVQATEVFNEHGWTVTPTLCPDCAGLSVEGKPQ